MTCFRTQGYADACLYAHALKIPSAPACHRARAAQRKAQYLPSVAQATPRLDIKKEEQQKKEV